MRTYESRGKPLNDMRIGDAFAFVGIPFDQIGVQIVSLEFLEALNDSPTCCARLRRPQLSPADAISTEGT